MGTDRIVEVFLGVMTLIVGYASFWLATKSTRIESGSVMRAVDAGAYERARQIYDAALDTLREELDDCRKELAVVRRELKEARQTIAELQRNQAG